MRVPGMSLLGIFDGTIFAEGLQLPGISVDRPAAAAAVADQKQPSSSPSSGQSAVPTSLPTSSAPSAAPLSTGGGGGGGFGGFGGGGLFGEMVAMAEHSQHIWDQNGAPAPAPSTAPIAVSAPLPLPYQPQPQGRASGSGHHLAIIAPTSISNIPSPAAAFSPAAAASPMGPSTPMNGISVTTSPIASFPSNHLMVPNGAVAGVHGAFIPSPSHSPMAAPMNMPPPMSLPMPSMIPSPSAASSPPYHHQMQGQAQGGNAYGIGMVPTSSMLQLPSSLGNNGGHVRAPSGGHMSATPKSMPSYPPSSGQSADAPLYDSSLPVQPYVHFLFSHPSLFSFIWPL
jgi:hypothetical protein